MIENLINSLDTTKIEDAIKNTIIIIPEVITSNDDNFISISNDIHISLIQIKFTQDGVPEIEKIFVNINPKTELIFDKQYKFQGTEFYLDCEPDKIYNCDKDGYKIFEYYINRNSIYNNDYKEEFMINSTGEIFYPACWEVTNQQFETIRHNLFSQEKLLCYSVKQNEYIKVMIVINQNLDINTIAVK